MTTIINVSEGLLQGKECSTYYGKKYYSFEGIPYAKPPVGKLRFKNPEPPESWIGIREATKPGNKCCQLNPKTFVEGSEDCLYLNVYTPCLPYEKIQKLPVLFFVHGGRLAIGFGDYYKPDYLIKHDVILVTINYRLNILGFLCLHIPEAPGNVALKDTIFALRWVQKNIKSFNGNPDNVTVVGESAGAAIITSYLTSKMADGLFHKVIAQSGTAISDLYVTGEDPIKKARVVAAALGKDLTDSRSLYNFFVDCPVEDLIMASCMIEVNEHIGLLAAHFLPVIEKKFDNVERFFDEAPRIDIMNGRFKKVPVLNGQNSHEGALFVQRDSEGKVMFQRDLYYYIPPFLNVKQNTQRSRALENKIREFYFKNKRIDESTISEYVDLFSDAYFHKDFHIFSDYLTKYSNEVYYFKYQYAGNLSINVMKKLGLKGASHGDMIQYQFYKDSKHKRSSKKDIEIIDFLSETWCNFAKNGKPTWTNQKIEWRPYTQENKNILIIDNEIELKNDVDLDKIRFWKSIIEDRSKL